MVFFESANENALRNTNVHIPIHTMYLINHRGRTQRVEQIENRWGVVLNDFEKKTRINDNPGMFG